MSNKESHSSTSAIENWPREPSGSDSWQKAGPGGVSRPLLASAIIGVSLVGQWLAFAFGAITRDASRPTIFCTAPCTRHVHWSGWTAFLFLPEALLLVGLVLSVFLAGQRQSALRWITVAFVPLAVLAVGLTIAAHPSIIDALPHGWWFGKWR